LIFNCDCKFPETVKYRSCEPSNVVIALEALIKGDIGLNAEALLSLFVIIPEETLR